MALRLPAFFMNLGHSNVILTAGGGAFGHKDGPKQGAISCAQAEVAWYEWKMGTYGDVSLSDGVIEFAKTHEEMKGAFLTFQKDADQIYPGWKEKLGYTGESSVQAASFDWKKKSAASAFVGESSAAGTRKQSAVARQAGGAYVGAVDQFMFSHPSQTKQEYIADSGYFADGTSLVGAGNALFRPPMPDPHTPYSPLPTSAYIADTGHFANGEPVDKVGNALFR